MARDRRRRGRRSKAAEAEVDALDAIEGKIRTANRNAERQYAAKAELERRITEAEARENAAATEAKGVEAKRLAMKFINAYLDLDRMAVEMAATLDAVMADREALLNVNKVLTGANRGDLRGKRPEELLAELGGFNSEWLPQVTTWSLHGYFPERSAITESRRFSRLRELLPPATSSRKAA